MNELEQHLKNEFNFIGIIDAFIFKVTTHFEWENVLVNDSIVDTVFWFTLYLAQFDPFFLLNFLTLLYLFFPSIFQL